MAVAFGQEMRVALPTWNGRISPVFDVAREAVVVDLEDGLAIRRDDVRLDGPSAVAKARQLVDLRVDVLICGAISRDLDETLSLAGIEVIPQTRGRTDDVLEAFASGRLTARAFLMPGCDRHRRRVPNRPGREEDPR